MFDLQKEKDGKGISADQIHRRFITKKNKSLLDDIIKTFEIVIEMPGTIVKEREIERKTEKDRER